MLRLFVTSTRLLLIFLLLTGVVYPLLVTAAAQLVFPAQANGSLIYKGSLLSGSTLIGQPFSDPKYFWGRLSAASGEPYNASASGGSNDSVMSPRLEERATLRIAALHASDPANLLPVPVDLATSSGSGLDPQISLAAAKYQVGRIAAARGISREQVEGLIEHFVRGRVFGILGEPTINVLEINLALDELK